MFVIVGGDEYIDFFFCWLNFTKICPGHISPTIKRKNEIVFYMKPVLGPVRCFVTHFKIKMT